MKSFVLGVIATVVVLLGAGVVTIYSGAYNVAADKPHTAIEAWMLGTTMTNSIKLRASGTTPPADLDSEARVHAGFHLFDEMCVQCHGAPGKEPGEVGKGLRPQPPDLTKAASRWNTVELFWIVNHGIRATGMPGRNAHRRATVEHRGVCGAITRPQCREIRCPGRPARSRAARSRAARSRPPRSSALIKRGSPMTNGWIEVKWAGQIPRPMSRAFDTGTSPLRSGSLASLHEVHHFLETDGPILIDVHCLEDFLVSRLKLLQ